MHVVLHYDEDAAAAMLVALRRCPESQRLDTLAVVMKVFIEHPERLAALGAAGVGEQQGGQDG